MNETDSGLKIWPNSAVKTHDSWSFKIVLSIFDSVRAPLVISHHRWDFPHRWWNIFTFDVTSFDARMRSSAFGFDWNGQYF
jgi:hypothetical protein